MSRGGSSLFRITCTRETYIQDEGRQFDDPQGFCAEQEVGRVFGKGYEVHPTKGLEVASQGPLTSRERRLKD